ncbi:MAG TPA: hypothetical protein VF796_14905 [Humisphaera sp.]
MGRWGDSFFDDDLASDVMAEFGESVADGKDPAKVAAAILRTELAREVLDEFTDEERDATFWEESSGLFYAAAVLQIEHDVLKPKTRSLALKAIEFEKAQGAEGERLKLLSELEAKLRKQ